MINLADAKPGFHVWYGERSDPEYGVIVRTNERYVFVRFASPGLALMVAQACRPEDLHWPPAFCAFDSACPPGQLWSYS